MHFALFIIPVVFCGGCEFYGVACQKGTAYMCTYKYAIHTLRGFVPLSHFLCLCSSFVFLFIVSCITLHLRCFIVTLSIFVVCFAFLCCRLCVSVVVAVHLVAFSCFLSLSLFVLRVSSAVAPCGSRKVHPVGNWKLDLYQMTSNLLRWVVLRLSFCRRGPQIWTVAQQLSCLCDVQTCVIGSLQRSPLDIHCRTRGIYCNQESSCLRLRDCQHHQWFNVRHADVTCGRPARGQSFRFH